MVASTRWWCACWLGVFVLSGCKSTAKHDNPVFGPSPARTSMKDADDAIAIANLEVSEGSDTGEEVKLVSSSEDAELPSDDEVFNATVVARVNGAPVFAGEVLEQWGEVLQKERQRLPPEQYPKLREYLIRQSLKHHIEKHLIVERTKGEIKPEQLKQMKEFLEKKFEEDRVEELKKVMKVNNRTELEREFKSRGTSLKNAKDQYVLEGMAGGYLQSKAKKPELINRRDVVNYYREHEDDYKFPAKARWQQIQISFLENQGRRGAEQKFREAIEALDAGATFEAVVEKYSDGPTAKEKGMRDWIQEGSLADAKLDELLFTMPVDQEFHVHEGPDSWQIVRVLERTPAGIKPFEDVWEEIQAKLQRESAPSNIPELIEQLYEGAVIETEYDYAGKRPPSDKAE